MILPLGTNTVLVSELGRGSGLGCYKPSVNIPKTITQDVTVLDAITLCCALGAWKPPAGQKICREICIGLEIQAPSASTLLVSSWREENMLQPTRVCEKPSS